MKLKSVRVERVVARHFGGRDEVRGQSEVLRLLEEGPGIKFSPSGPSCWSKRLEQPNRAILDLCNFSALALRDKRLDLVVTFDAGGNTRLVATTLAARTRRLCHHPIGVYSVEFAQEPGQKRLRRAISYDGDPRSAVAGKRVFLYGDVLEHHCYVLRLAKEIAIYGRKMAAAGRPERVPKIVGIGAAVIRDYGIKEHIETLLGFVPELHFLVHARRDPRETSDTERNGILLSLDTIRHEVRRPQRPAANG